METSVFFSLLEKHFEVLRVHYQIASDDEHWLTLQRYHDRLQRAADLPLGDISDPVPYDFREANKLMITGHWRLLRGHEGEPPTYLVAAVDEIEQQNPVWFSYERGAWIDD